MNKLDKLKEYIVKCLHGAKLKNIELSETENILPTGELHKNKHDDFGIEGITEKGIPVLQVKDDTAETIQEVLLQAEGGEVVLTCEVEREEVIFAKELTDYIEKNRELWKNGTQSEKDKICLEVGKRITKELLFNTIDKANLIDKIEMNS